MIEDNAVLNELKLKNKEIYLNKLEIDLENNFAVLSITCDNLHQLFNQELMDKITEILSSTFNKENISIAVNKFNQTLKDNVIKLLEKKNQNLKNSIINIDDVDYRELIDMETKSILDEIKKVYQKGISHLIKTIINEYTRDKQIRIEDYLNNIYFEKYILKITEIIINMDNILYNNYEESLNKYHDLNEKTLKI